MLSMMSGTSTDTWLRSTCHVPRTCGTWHLRGQNSKIFSQISPRNAPDNKSGPALISQHRA